MARNTFDQIKQIIRDQTHKTPGIVSNLHGTVETVVAEEEQPAGQSWLALTVPARALPSLREFVDLYAYEKTPYGTLNGRNGRTVYPVSGQLPAGQAVLLLTSVNLSAPTSLPIQVEAPGYDYAIYMGDTRVATGRGSAGHTIRLGAGVHYLSVILFGGTAPIQISVPEKYGLLASEPIPPAPILAGDPIAEYLSAGIGSYQVTVQWGNDAFASAWGVYRAEALPVGKILAFTPNDDNVSAVVRVTGTHEYQGTEDFYTRDFYAGRVLSMTQTTDALGQPVTDIEILLAVTAPSDDPNVWVGQDYMRPDRLTSMGRVTYAGDATPYYVDTSVKPGALYIYYITAFSFLTGSVESAFSEAGWVTVLDREPPDNIIFDPDTDLKMVNGEAVIEYQAPDQPDYNGVKIYLEDPSDPSNHILIATEFGSASERNQLRFRPPMAGTYWFRTFDSSGNVQPVGSGVSWTWDGKSQWVNSVHGLLVATVDEAAGTASLKLVVEGPVDMFPVQVRFYQDDLTAPMVLAPNVTEHVLNAPGVIDASVYPSLAGIALPLSGAVHWWAEIIDNEGSVIYAYTSADRGTLPGGTVVVEDYQPFPNFTLVYDEDVDKIEIEVPDSSGSYYGTVTFQRGVDFPAGGGSIIYDVGDPVVRRPDGTFVAETALPPEGSRGPYRVYYSAGSIRLLMWEGKLHGDSAREPTVDVRIQVDTEDRSAVDVFVRVESPLGEDVTLEFKDEDDPTLPIWQLVTGNGSSTIRYVSSGTEIDASAYFKRQDASSWAQKLNNIPLVDGQIKRIAVRAVGKDSQARGPWIIVPLPIRELGEINGVDLTFDEETDKLYLTAIAGNFTRSLRFEISDQEDFSTIAVTKHVQVQTGDRAFADLTLTTQDRGKRWYGRVTPFNGPLVNGNPTGLGGLPVRDSVYVWPIGGVEPTGSVKLVADEKGNLFLHVEAIRNTKSFRYVIRDDGYQSTPSGGTVVNFNSNGVAHISVGTIQAGKTKYATVWFYEQQNAGGEVGNRVLAELYWVPAPPPYFGIIQQIRQATDPEKYDFQVQIFDPIGRGGTFRAWTNKTGRSSADPAGPPDGTYEVPNTPLTITGGMVSALSGVLTNAQEDKYVYFEFVNSDGQSTGVRPVKVTTKFVDVGPDGKLSPGVVDIDHLREGLRVIREVDTLPATGTNGEMVFLKTDGLTYTWFNGAWRKPLEIVDLQGQLGIEHLKSGLTLVKTVSSLPPTGQPGEIVVLTTDGHTYTWHAGEGRWIKAIERDDLLGARLLFINNFSVSGNLKGWTGYGSGSLVTDRVKDGKTVRTLNITTSGSVTVYSDYVEIDPTATYEVSLSIFSDHVDSRGTRRFGVAAYDENQNQLALIPFNISNRTFETETSTAYFWSGAVYGGQWRDMTAYVLGCNVTAGEVQPGKNVTYHFKLPPNAKYIRIFFANANNSGVSVRNDFYSPSISLASSTTIHGDSIVANSIRAAKLSIASLDEIADDLGIVVKGRLVSQQSPSVYLDLNATGTQKFINTPKFYINANGDAYFDGALGANTVAAIRINASQVNVSKLSNFDPSGEADLGIIVAGRLWNNNKTQYIDLNATNASSYFISTPKFYIKGNGDAYFDGTLGANTIGAIQISASQVTVNSLQEFTQNMGIMVSGKLQGANNSGNFIDLNAANSGSAVFLQAGSGALKIYGNGSAEFGGTLQAASGTFGIITGGYLRNSSNTAAIRLSGTTTLPSTNFIDFTATGSSPFIKHNSLTLTADGNATFSGTVVLKDGSNNKISFQTIGGVEYGSIWAYGSEYGGALGFWVNPRAQVFLTYDMETSRGVFGFAANTVIEFAVPPSTGVLDQWRIQRTPASTNSDDKLSFLYGGNEIFAFYGDGSQMWAKYSPVPGKWYWQIRDHNAVNWPHALMLSYGGKSSTYNQTDYEPNLCFWFSTNGRAYADDGWSTFSPKPPKPVEAMTAKDWLEWAATDARKPVKPYAGIPHEDHPEVRKIAARRAKAHGRTGVSKNDIATVMQEEIKKYEKDVSKIAIGTARWADLVFDALKKAKDFDEFKALLGLN